MHVPHIKAAPSEEILKKHFRMTYLELDTALNELLIAHGGRLPDTSITVPKLERNPAAINVRAATRDETEDLRNGLLEWIKVWRKTFG